jgi:hypothetical protein
MPTTAQQKKPGKDSLCEESENREKETSQAREARQGGKEAAREGGCWKGNMLPPHLTGLLADSSLALHPSLSDLRPISSLWCGRAPANTRAGFRTVSLRFWPICGGSGWCLGCWVGSGDATVLRYVGAFLGGSEVIVAVCALLCLRPSSIC